MASSVVALFDTHEQAYLAVQQLIASGYDSRAISVVGADTGGHIRKETVDESGNLASAGAISGATSGLLVGGLIGLLVGATALAVPPAGFVVAGPLAGLITGAGIGAVSGGLLGALIGLGIPEEEAHIYAESVRRGGVLVTVQIAGAEALQAETILRNAGAVNIQERGSLYRQSGFATYDPSAPVYTQEEIIAERQRYGVLPQATTAVPVTGVVPGTTVTTGAVPVGGVVTTGMVPPAGVVTTTTTGAVPAGSGYIEETVVTTPTATAFPAELDAEFRHHFTGSIAPTSIGSTYETFMPAYHYGYELAARPEFRSLSWDAVEAQARMLWEQSNPGTYERFRHAIFAGWTRANSGTPLTQARLM